MFIWDLVLWCVSLGPNGTVHPPAASNRASRGHWRAILTNSWLASSCQTAHTGTWAESRPGRVHNPEILARRHQLPKVRRARILRWSCASTCARTSVALAYATGQRAIMDVRASPVDRTSAPQAKIALFRSLFRGRDDVYARRFESRKTGKSGYAPACSNEWVRGICEKPRVKCAECPNRRFLPVTDDVIRWHLSGYDPEGQPFVAGIYPLLQDETCFLRVRE